MFLAVALGLIVVCWLRWGSLGALGSATGVVGTGISFAAMRWGLSVLGKLMESGDDTRSGGCLGMLMLMVKLPVVIGLGVWMSRLGGAALGSFLAGMLLVYFAVIGWAHATR